ncbi:MAG: RHS repeat-associated core domain-containing protein [Blastocatellia bacterium]|nr:RHS repeat-associated core domain-containing protein [Blastocatellia bacterium]
MIGEYFYDGEGKRVKKHRYVGGVLTEVTVCVYSAGKLAAEYSTATPSSNPTTSWTVTDQLGSPRVIVNSLGAVISRRDFMPFGEELDADETYRKTLQKYGQTDSVRQQFTGYQKDEESGLDFAEARMYENRFGRFTAVDPLLASGKDSNPQTFNRFVYVGNNPLNIIDPLGLEWWRVRNKQNKTDSIFWSTETPVGEEGDVVDKWTEYVYKANDGLWYSLDPNSDSFMRFYSQERAEWDNGYYTGFNGYGNIPVYNSFLTMVSGIKTGNVGRGLLGFGELSITFATAPRTIGGLLKEGAEEGISYVTGLPILNPFKPKRVGNEEIIQRAANFADAKRMRNGFDADAVGGTKAHKYAETLINRYQRRFGDVGLETESSWLNGRTADYRGQKGSIRLDVLDLNSGNIYDFKFGKAGLTERRIEQIRQKGPRNTRSIFEVRPE